MDNPALIITTALFVFVCTSCAESTESTHSEKDWKASTLSDTETNQSAAPRDSDTETNNLPIDTAESCDGENVDCYNQCWQCAYENECKDKVDECKTDEGCNALHQCIERECCSPDNPFDCLDGLEGEICYGGCKETLNTSSHSITLHVNIKQCVACTACSSSCTDLQSWCASIDMAQQISQMTCFEEDATDEQPACLTWIRQDPHFGCGTYEIVQACYNSPECMSLEQCIQESWAHDNWLELQQLCYETAGEQITEDHQTMVLCEVCLCEDVCSMWGPKIDLCSQWHHILELNSDSP